MYTWSWGDTDTTMVGPRDVVYVWAAGDADIKSRAVLVIEYGVVEIVPRIDVMEFGDPEMSVASTGRCGWTEEEDVGAKDRVAGAPGTVYRGRRGEK